MGPLSDKASALVISISLANLIALSAVIFQGGKLAAQIENLTQTSIRLMGITDNLMKTDQLIIERLGRVEEQEKERTKR